MNSIEVRSAVKSYDKKHLILNGLNLTVKSGSIYSLIGASGCGKTTLLSCILGMKQLDQGSISVYGQDVIFEKPSKYSNLIGYMPQETALVGELTIKETLYFFGNIFQMDMLMLSSRFKMLCELLDLKFPNKCVKQLSGGEKRRVSLAAAIIHNPQILILDEPTVGLDSILREKIWKFLIETTSNSNLSVIITTHYIAEAEKSNCCGLMRNGILLAEESPQKIINRYSLTNLDEVFLNLCLSQTKSKIFTDSYDDPSTQSIQLKDINGNLQLNNFETVNEFKNVKFDERKKFKKQTLKALWVKEWIRIKRQPAEIIFIFILPTILSFGFAFAIGRNPTGLKIGIVNNEINDSKFCGEFLESTNFTFSSNSCYFENLSCYFLNEIQDSISTKIYYKSYKEALRDAKESLISGFISISSNITHGMSEKKIDWQPLDKIASDSNVIQVYLDHTNPIVAAFLRHKLFKAYERFNKKILRQCKLNDILEDLPLNTDQGLVYGTFEDDYTTAMIPGIFGQTILLCGVLFSISTISQCRVEGVWNRTLLAGVTTSEILLVYVFMFIIIDILQMLALKSTMMLLYDLSIIGSELHIGMFALMIYMVGSSFGLLTSIYTNKVLAINCAGVLVFAICGTLSGSFCPFYNKICSENQELKPFEAQHTLIKCFSFILPITIPSISMKNIIAKGFGFTHPSVYGGFSVLCVWMIIILSLCFVTLKRKRFTEGNR